MRGLIVNRKSGLGQKGGLQTTSCLICNNSVEFPSPKKDRGFKNRVRILCKYLSLPETFLREFISSPICSICRQLIASIFQLHHSLEMMGLRLKLKRDTIVKHLKSQYKVNKEQFGESEAIVKSAVKLKRRIQIALGIGPEDVTRNKEDCSSEQLTSPICAAETDLIFRSTPVAKKSRVCEKTDEEAYGGLEPRMSNIRIDHYYSLNSDVKTPQRPQVITLRNCYVSLQRLPMKTNSQVSDDQAVSEDETEDPAPFIPEFPTQNEMEIVKTEIVSEDEELEVRKDSRNYEELEVRKDSRNCIMQNEMEKVKTEIVSEDEELEVRKDSQVIVPDDNENFNGDNPNNLGVPETSTNLKKELLVQCAYGCHSPASYCGMWFVDEIERDVHMERFHSKAKWVPEPKITNGSDDQQPENGSRVNVLNSIQSDHYYSLKPAIKISEENVFRNSHVQLKRPPVNTHISEAQRHRAEVSELSAHKAISSDETELRSAVGNTFLEESSMKSFTSAPVIINENDPDDDQITTECKSHKTRLAQCLHVDRISGPCLLWFADEEARKSHFNRFHTTPLVSTREKEKRIKEKVTYECPAVGCGQVFLRKLGLRFHSYSHSGKYPYNCKKCSTGFVKISLLQKHEEAVHFSSKLKATFVSSLDVSGRSKYVCTEQDCGKVFRQKLKLRQHSYSHTGKYPYRCKTCDIGITSYAQFKKHKDTHESSEARTPGNLVFVERLPRSVKCPSVHPGNKPCKWIFRDEIDMQAHVKRYHLRENPKNSYSCPHCQFSTNRKNRLEKHIKKQHMGGTGCFICEICGMSYWEQLSLEMHRIRKHDIKGAYVCEDETCGKSFGSRAELKRHRCVHLGQYPFPCGHCDSGFLESHHLSNHIRKEHSVSALDFVCRVCQKKFENNAKLQRHKIVHSDERPFACHLCSWTFKLKGQLKRHITKVHTKSRPFLCQECGASFKITESLTQHLRFHSSRKKPFVPRNRRIKSPPRTLAQQPVVLSHEDLSLDVSSVLTVEYLALMEILSYNYVITDQFIFFCYDAFRRVCTF
ncbi:unnamed protein product [Allacma fusca]|uniref:C2H2-type domain-containing protein n=1 Tax=Allacma fusca TaxID=39272 RepID=A0A8J2P3G6_9HEXA|nr:unnamed protein product [Allacma fusca]